MIRRHKGLIQLVSGFLAIFVFSVPASIIAADGTSFYRGKTITFVVPFSPGGGYDAYARMITPFLEKETGASVVVRNMPGGETYTGMRYVYHAKPDGLNIIIIEGRTAVLYQLYDDPKAKGMDVRRFNWLARPIDEPSVLLLSTKHPFRSIEDIKKAKHTITCGSAARLTNQHLALAIFAEVFGLDAKLITGFGGSSVQVLAAMRGELTGWIGTASSAAEYDKHPELFPLVTVSTKRTPLLPNVPAASELMPLNPEQLRWFELLDKIMAVGRAIVTTPEVPQERVKFLRDAFRRVLTSKELQAVSHKTKRPIEYLSGEEVQKIAEEILGMDKKTVGELKAILDRHVR